MMSYSSCNSKVKLNSMQFRVYITSGSVQSIKNCGVNVLHVVSWMNCCNSTLVVLCRTQFSYAYVQGFGSAHVQLEHLSVYVGIYKSEWCL